MKLYVWEWRWGMCVVMATTIQEAIMLAQEKIATEDIVSKYGEPDIYDNPVAIYTEE